MTIEILPDLALLEIFDFYLIGAASIEAWHTLVHVCRKWRDIVFRSPHRLNLRLSCQGRTPVRELLDIWPLLPIVVWGNDQEKYGSDNIIAALEHNDRICGINLSMGATSQQLKNVLPAMQEPFPALTSLLLGSKDETLPVIPDTFLGRYAPRLRYLNLESIPIPGLPRLLLSATDLVGLYLLKVPLSGYISPEAMTNCLSTLTRLKSLTLTFQSPRSRPVQEIRRPPLPTRTLLPALTHFTFKGVSEYFEDLVARIDIPLLYNLNITFFHQLRFDIPQLAQFISRTPKFKESDLAYLHFFSGIVRLSMSSTDGVLQLSISCRQRDWQISSIAQLCMPSSHQALIPTVKRLKIRGGRVGTYLQDDIENSQWLDIFSSFTAVKDLCLGQDIMTYIAPALQELVGERVTEVLPSLQRLSFGPKQSTPVEEAIRQFAAARRLSGHPITVSLNWPGR